MVSCHTLNLFQKTVNLIHLHQCNFGPSLLLDDRLHFLSKRLDVLRMSCKVDKYLSEALPMQGCQIEKKHAASVGTYVESRLPQ